MKPERVALYVRVSTCSQTVENQKRELEAVADRRGWSVARVYEDAGISGAEGEDRREGLRELMKDARRRRFDRVAVWSVDRLGRSTAQVAVALQELEAAGVKFYADKEGIDSGTPHGRAMLQMAAVFGELERAMIRERVLSGLARAKAQGKKLGRPAAGLEKEAKKLRGRGLSMRAIANKLGVSVGLIHGYLKRQGVMEDR